MALTIITDAPAINHTGNPVKVVLHSDNTVTGHRVVIRFFTVLNSWTLFTDASGNVTFDLAKFIEAFMPGWEGDFPVTTSPEWVDCTFNKQTYPITMSDEYEGSTEGVDALGTYTFVKGGLSFEFNKKIDFWNTYFIADVPNYPFLTWRNRSKKKYTTPGAIEFLTYYIADAYDNIVPKIKAFGYDDSEIGTETIPLTTPACTFGAGHLVRFGFGFGHVNYPSILTPNDVKFFDVWLDNDGTVISEVRRYYIDRKKYNHDHLFIYSNSLAGGAGIDTVIMHGEINQTQEVTRTILNKYVPPAYTVTNGSKGIGNISSVNSFKAAYYPESDFEKLLMQDMFLSLKVAKWEDGILKPIIITSSKVALGNNKDTIPLIEFEYIYAFDNQYSTPGSSW